MTIFFILNTLIGVRYGVLELSFVFMDTSPPSQFLITLDVEGVLTPEIWIAVANHFGIDELRRTTKDEPNYQLLMEQRIRLINEHNISLADIQTIISSLSPLDGALAFLNELRSTVSVVLLSDTFEEFIGPLMLQLQNPLVLCHRLIIDENGNIASFAERTQNQKFEAVRAFQKLNYQVIAAGDSYNDLSMIDQADAGYLFRAPNHVRTERPDLECFDDYSDLLSSIKKVIENGC